MMHILLSERSQEQILGVVKSVMDGIISGKMVDMQVEAITQALLDYILQQNLYGKHI
jgi:hypothetical protein